MNNKIAMIYYFAGFPIKAQELLYITLNSYSQSNNIDLYIASLTHYDSWKKYIDDRKLKNITIINYSLDNLIDDCKKFFDIDFKEHEFFKKIDYVNIGRKFLCSFKPYNILFNYDLLKEYEFIGYTEYDIFYGKNFFDILYRRLIEEKKDRAIYCYKSGGCFQIFKNTNEILDVLKSNQIKDNFKKWYYTYGDIRYFDEVYLTEEQRKNPKKIDNFAKVLHENKIMQNYIDTKRLLPRVDENIINDQYIDNAIKLIKNNELVIINLDYHFKHIKQTNETTFNLLYKLNI